MVQCHWHQRDGSGGLSSVLPQPQVEVLSEEEGEEDDEEEDILSLAEEKYRPAALEKMIALIALLVEQSRSERSGTGRRRL